MVIVADGSRRGAFEQAKAMAAFKKIEKLVRFWDYEQVGSYYEQVFKVRELERELGI